MVINVTGKNIILLLVFHKRDTRRVKKYEIILDLF